MIKIDENDPIGEVEPSFPFRDVRVKKNVDVKQFFDLQKEIGRGKFGTVYKCRERTTGLKLAAKFISIAKRQDRRNAEKEVEIMRELQHPRLIQIYDAYEMNNIMCVILELIEGGELFERVIDDDFVLTEKSVAVFMKQICEGVAFIHSKNVLHLDMKPENILCLTRNGNRIKIIDFGLARKYDPEKKLQVLFGTPEFVAPEVVNFDSIGFGTDMWSVGVICYVLLSGLSPFMGETDVATMANVTIAHYDFDDEAFNDISQNAKDFISKLLIKDREARMSATQCLSHPWLQTPSKPPPPPPPQIQHDEYVFIDENDLNDDRRNELDYEKDSLRNIVDRWNSQTSLVNVTAEEMADELKLKLIELPEINNNDNTPSNNNSGLLDEKRKLTNVSSDRVIEQRKSSHSHTSSTSTCTTNVANNNASRQNTHQIQNSSDSVDDRNTLMKAKTETTSETSDGDASGARLHQSAPLENGKTGANRNERKPKTKTKTKTAANEITEKNNLVDSKHGVNHRDRRRIICEAVDAMRQSAAQSVEKLFDSIRADDRDVCIRDTSTTTSTIDETSSGQHDECSTMRQVNAHVDNSSLRHSSNGTGIDRGRGHKSNAAKSATVHTSVNGRQSKQTADEKIIAVEIESKLPMPTKAAASIMADHNANSCAVSPASDEYANSEVKIEPHSIVSHTSKSRKTEIKVRKGSKQARAIIRDSCEHSQTNTPARTNEYTRTNTTSSTLKNIFKNETIRNILQNFEQPREKIMAVTGKTTRKENCTGKLLNTSHTTSNKNDRVEVVASETENVPPSRTDDARVDTNTRKMDYVTGEIRRANARDEIENNDRENGDKLADEKSSVKQTIERNESVANVVGVAGDLFDKTTAALTRRRISDISGLRVFANKYRNVSDHYLYENTLLNQLQARMRSDSFSKSVAAAAADDDENTIIGDCGRFETMATKRPKFRMSFFSRDVPLQQTAATAGDSNLLNYLSWCVQHQQQQQQQNNEDCECKCDEQLLHQRQHHVGNELACSSCRCILRKNSHHSDPGSMRNSPERMCAPRSLTKKMLCKLLDAAAVERVVGVAAPSSSTATAVSKNKAAEIAS